MTDGRITLSGRIRSARVTASTLTTCQEWNDVLRPRSDRPPAQHHAGGAETSGLRPAGARRGVAAVDRPGRTDAVRLQPDQPAVGRRAQPGHQGAHRPVVPRGRIEPAHGTERHSRPGGRTQPAGVRLGDPPCREPGSGCRPWSSSRSTARTTAAAGQVCSIRSSSRRGTSASPPGLAESGPRGRRCTCSARRRWPNCWAFRTASRRSCCSRWPIRPAVTSSPRPAVRLVRSHSSINGDSPRAQCPNSSEPIPARDEG